jgi:hypothetical protein
MRILYNTPNNVLCYSIRETQYITHHDNRVVNATISKTFTQKLWLRFNSIFWLASVPRVVPPGRGTVTHANIYSFPCFSVPVIIKNLSSS